MGRTASFQNEIGKQVIVYVGDGDLVEGVLAEVTEDGVFVDETDDVGEVVGLRHIIPWGSVYRILSMDVDSDHFMASDHLPEPPAWVDEVLKDAAKKE